MSYFILKQIMQMNETDDFIPVQNKGTTDLPFFKQGQSLRSQAVRREQKRIGRHDLRRRFRQQVIAHMTSQVTIRDEAD